MKKANFCLISLLTVLMSMVGVKTSAHDIAVVNADGVTIYYNWNSDKTELAVTYRGDDYNNYDNEYSGNVAIPSSVTYEGKEYSVTSIGYEAFRDCSGLTSIEIPNSVTNISYSAFDVNSSTKYNFEDYVYPFGCRTYASPDSKGNLSSVTQYSFESHTYDNYLIEEVYTSHGMMSAKSTYRYHTEENAVISDVQLRQNKLTGSTKYQDRLILFAFPEKDKPFKWTEIDRGNKYQCISEYVYINASINHNSYFLKSIKITKENRYIIENKKHRIIETSYWVSNYGRIITYVDWDGTKRVSSKLDILNYIQEISEEEYNTQIKK